MKPRGEAQKEITFLNTTFGQELLDLGATNRITLLVEARKMSTKHNLLLSAFSRIEIMHQGLENFNKSFHPLYQKGFPKFWGPDGKLIPRGKYLELLNQARVNCANF